MMLSRKYYEVFAKIFGRSKDKEQALMMAVDFFAEDNPLFDRTKFFDAIRKEQAKRLAEVI